MDPVACEQWLKAWKRETCPSDCLLMNMPPEIKILIMYHMTPGTLSRLGQSCQTWYQFTLPELYARDAKEGYSSAIRWMAAHAVDEDTTEIALNTLEISARYGGQVDVISEYEGQKVYKNPTALHQAIARRNLRLAKKLLDMGARHDIPCLDPFQFLFASQPEELMARLNYFENAFDSFCTIGMWFPIFLAFFVRDPDMGQLLVDRGAGREAMLSPSFVDIPCRILILHFAAADTTEEIGQWHFLFDSFRKHINQRCTEKEETPLHIALRCGSVQSMQLALEAGAKMEINNAYLLTPLVALARGLDTFCIQTGNVRNQNHIICIRNLVELGGSIHPGGDSVMVYVMGFYFRNPDMWPDMIHALNFFLDHGVDLNERSLTGTNVVSQLVPAICTAAPPAMEAFKELLHDLVDKGLDLTRLPLRGSPLNSVISQTDAQPAWLFDLLCEKGATILRSEVDYFFIRWFEIPRLWMGNQYDIWQHVEQVSLGAAVTVYSLAMSSDTPSLFDHFVCMPLLVPPVSTLVGMASYFRKTWSWSRIVAREFKGNFTTWDEPGKESILHGTIRFFKVVPGYSAADAIQDISKLMRDGVDMTMRNEAGQNPLELLLHMPCDKTDCSELTTFLERELERAHHLQAQQEPEGASNEFVSELVGSWEHDEILSS
ncbi:hypothetical protein E4U61_003309 [Claviceps capensis]|nr:hypothetical protein E4U61_003309 [Claviceps capensis]